MNPFVKGISQYAGDCTDGGLQVTDGTIKACVSTGIIDYCKTYNTGFTASATTINVGCK